MRQRQAAQLAQPPASTPLQLAQEVERSIATRPASTLPIPLLTPAAAALSQSPVEQPATLALAATESSWEHVTLTVLLAPLALIPCQLLQLQARLKVVTQLVTTLPTRSLIPV